MKPPVRTILKRSLTRAALLLLRSLRRAAILLLAVLRHRGVQALLAVFIGGVLFSPVKEGTGFPVYVSIYQWLHNLFGGHEVIRTGVPLFLQPTTQKNVVFEYAEYGILATGMTAVILTGGIDLSVGSVLGLSATLCAIFLIQFGWSPVTAIALCLLTGSALGATSGVLISRFRIQPFVATLAMMVAARGLAKLVSGGQKIQPGMPGSVLTENPPLFDAMTRWFTWQLLTPITLLFLVGIVVLWLVVRYTRFGRYLYAIGGNEEAARLSGIRVSWVKVIAYALCGLMAALAGVCNASQLTQGDPEAGFTYELDAIAAVVIGGTSLMGGRGGVMLTLLGTLIIGYMNKILSLNGAEEAIRLLAKGGIIIAAVLIQRRRD